ncbi:glycosyltransferase family 2 protein [Geodermatophilus sp. SYSU D00700]
MEVLTAFRGPALCSAMGKSTLPAPSSSPPRCRHHDSAARSTWPRRPLLAARLTGCNAVPVSGSETSAVSPVSVVISTLDRPVSLARCLDALLAGTHLPTEIVVVDQGHYPTTASVLDARRSAGVPLVHISQQRLGLSTSQNTGVMHATCPIVAIVDDDCVPDAHWVETVAREHALTSQPSVIGGRVLPLPPKGERTEPLALRTSTARLVLPSSAVPWAVGTGGNFTVTRDAYLRVGGNDERLGTGTSGRAGNDLDLFHRLMRAGVEARFSPDLLVHHERATPREFRTRCWNYGFGMGLCVTTWLADHDHSAFRVLFAWIVMRLRMLLRARGRYGVGNEIRVVLGTAHGLWHGLRLPRRHFSAELPA